MPDLNSPDLAPVSFIRGGLTIRGQVHLQGTYAYIPVEQAEWTDEDQIAEYGDVFYRPGLRGGFTPASETYLAPSNRERIRSDREATLARRRASVSEVEEDTRPGNLTAAADRRTAEQIALDEAANVGPLSSARPAVGPPRIPAGEDPAPGSLLTADGSPIWEPDDDASEADGAVAGAPAPPWDDAAELTLDEVRARLARSDEDVVRQFVLWERARTDREPRKTILAELPEFE